MSTMEVERLSAEIATLRATNLELQRRVDRVLAPANSPDDLASALQRTVDGLQTKLASLSNPISNFAVKDFRLETNVAVSITPLGTLEYRLLQPGANVEPGAISKLTVSLVPIEKQVPAGTLSPVAFEPQKELAAIGIGGELRQFLEENHIFTIGDFRGAAMRAQVRASLIASEKVTQQELARLQARAELAMLSGVDAAIADRLIAAGVDSLQAVARTTAAGLTMIASEIDAADAERWIVAAQSFTGISETTQRVVRIDSNPPNLLLRLNREPFAAQTIVRQLPLRQPLSVATFRHQLIGRTGYTLDGWSTGAASSSHTLPAPTSTTARFRLACHHVHAASASRGGILTIEPRVGGVAGFPANCYAPGTRIELVAHPEEGFTLSALTITAGGRTSTVATQRTPMIVDGPISATATFRPLRLDVRDVREAV